MKDKRQKRREALKRLRHALTNAEIHLSSSQAVLSIPAATKEIKENREKVVARATENRNRLKLEITHLEFLEGHIA